MKRPAPDRPPAGNPADRSRGVVVDEATGTAFADGKPLPLSRTEFLLLRTLAAQLLLYLHQLRELLLTLLRRHFAFTLKDVDFNLRLI